jgi:hypothetical protein
MAGQREVVRAVAPAMLLRYDVLDMVGEFTMLLAQQAILTTVSRASPDYIARSEIHR